MAEETNTQTVPVGTVSADTPTTEETQNLESTNNSQPDLQAELTCPECETKQQVMMPEAQFQHYYKCVNEECMADLAPIEGKCCVFCSYADKLCPQRQVNPQPVEESKLQSLI